MSPLKSGSLYLGIGCWRQLSEYWSRVWLWAQDWIRLILALWPCSALHLMPFLLRWKSCSSCDPFLLHWCSTASSRGLKITIPDKKKCAELEKLIFFKSRHILVLSADILVFEHLGFTLFSATARGRSNLFARKTHHLMQSCDPRNWSFGFEEKINYSEIP